MESLITTFLKLPMNKGRPAGLSMLPLLRKKIIIWHWLWVENGKPRHGWVNDIRLRAKADYKRNSKWAIRNQEKLTADKIADQLLSESSRDSGLKLNEFKAVRIVCLTYYS